MPYRIVAGEFQLVYVGPAQLRLEGIDALEKHFQGTHR